MNKELINDICILSRNGVCLLDMKQVAEAAKRFGMTPLAELVTRELQEKKIDEGGQYWRMVAPLYGVTA